MALKEETIELAEGAMSSFVVGVGGEITIPMFVLEGSIEELRKEFLKDVPQNILDSAEIIYTILRHHLIRNNALAYDHTEYGFYIPYEVAYFKSKQ